MNGGWPMKNITFILLLEYCIVPACACVEVLDVDGDVEVSVALEYLAGATCLGGAEAELSSCLGGAEAELSSCLGGAEAELSSCPGGAETELLSCLGGAGLSWRDELPSLPSVLGCGDFNKMYGIN